MKPVHHPYTEWEDWQAGMWQTPTDLDRDSRRAAHILSSPDLFRHAARAMLRDWIRAAEHNLTTSLAHNRYAWIGQATCCHLAQVPEAATRAAWWTLTPAEQTVANAVAAEAIAEWERSRQAKAEPDLFTIDGEGVA
jgi:hypothetical protein